MLKENVVNITVINFFLDFAMKSRLLVELLIIGLIIKFLRHKIKFLSMIFAGSRFLSYNNRIFDSDKFDDSPGYNSGWFLLRFIISINQIEKNRIENQLETTFSISNKIQEGWYHVNFNEKQYITAQNFKEIKLFNPNHFRVATRSISSDDTFMVQSIPHWKPTNCSDIVIIPIFDDTYLVKNASIEVLQQDHNILSIKQAPEFRTQNRFVGGQLQYGSTEITIQDKHNIAYRPLQGRGINGKGVIVSIIDTGLDTMHCFYYDSNNTFKSILNKTNLNHRKVVRYDAFADISDPPNGHGTHVTGTISGESWDPISGIAAYNGVAPKSRLYFVDAGISEYKDKIYSIDYEKVMSTMRDFDSKILSNSWSAEKQLLEVTRIWDKAAVKYPRILAVFANGNIPGRNEVRSPQDSKNVLTVGFTSRPVESEIEERQFIPKLILRRSKIIDIFNYSKLYNDDQPIYIDYPLQFCDGKPDKCVTDPKKLIVCTDSIPNYQHPYIQVSEKDFEIASLYTTGSILFEPINRTYNFTINNSSSRGTTSIGVLKPDVVAPGTNTVSARASGKTDFETPGSCKFADLRSVTGSSMSVPAISGTLALIEQYFAEGWYPTLRKNPNYKINVTSSLLRAALINSCKSIDKSIVPNYREGHGMPSIEEGLGFGDRGVRFLNNVTIRAGQHLQYHIWTSQVADFSVTMAYIDDGDVSLNEQILKTDIDLIVRARDGKIYHGNNVPGEFTSTVEKVTIFSALPGRYVIDILYPTDSNHENQTVQFSLAVLGGFSTTYYALNPEPLSPSRPTAIGSCSWSGKLNSKGMCECNDATTGTYCQINYTVLEYGVKQNITLTPRIPFYFKFENKYAGSSSLGNFPGLLIGATKSRIRGCFSAKHVQMSSSYSCMTKANFSNNITSLFNDAEELYGLLYPIYDESYTINVTYLRRREIPYDDGKMQGLPIWVYALIAVLAALILSAIIVFVVLCLKSRKHDEEEQSDSF